MSKFASALLKSEIETANFPKPSGAFRLCLQIGENDIQPVLDLLNLAGQRPRVSRDSASNGVLVLDFERANERAARQFVIWLRELPGVHAVLIEA